MPMISSPTQRLAVLDVPVEVKARIVTTLAARVPRPTAAEVEQSGQ